MKIFVISLFLVFTVSANAQENVSSGIKKTVKKVENTEFVKQNHVVRTLGKSSSKISGVKKIETSNSKPLQKKSSSLKRISSLPKEKSLTDSYKESVTVINN